MKRILVVIFILAFLFSSLNGAPDRKKKLTGLKKDTTTTKTAPTSDSASTLKHRLSNRTTGQNSGVVKSKISPAQEKNIQKLMSDLNGMKSDSQVTPQQVQKLQQDLMNIVDGATKPSQQSVQELATDLSNVWVDGKITPKEQKELMDDIYTILNSANISVSEAEAVIADAKGILESSGLSKSDAQIVANDLKTIANEVQKNVTEAATSTTKKFSRFKK